MTFDFTKGKSAKYLVFIHMPDGCHDKLCFHYLKDAKDKFKNLCNSDHYRSGTTFTLYNADTDEQKAYKKI